MCDDDYGDDYPLDPIDAYGCQGGCLYFLLGFGIAGLEIYILIYIFSWIFGC